MERLTDEKQVGCFASLKDKAESVPGVFGTYDAFYSHAVAVTRLKAYEDAIPFDDLPRAAALVKARDEGRVVVLPEKLLEHAKQTSVELDCMTEVLEPCGDYKVKPCPFCRSKNIVYWQYRHAAGLRWRIACLHCMAMIDPGWVQQYGYLAGLWNTRAEAEPEVQQLHQEHLAKKEKPPMIDQDKPVPDDFRVFTRSGEVTGEKREQLYRVLDGTIDKVLEQLEGDDDD